MASIWRIEKPKTSRCRNKGLVRDSSVTSKLRGKSRLARLENLESWAEASQLRAVVTLSVRCCGRIFIQSVLMAT